MNKLFHFYQQYSHCFLPYILFFRIFVYVNIGFMSKKVWGRNKITLLKFFTGALFISLCIVSINKITPFNDGLLMLTSIFMGYGADNFMLKFIKNKYWDKFDIIEKFNKDDKG